MLSNANIFKLLPNEQILYDIDDWIFVESELDKYKTLAQETIQWDILEEKITSILLKQSQDIRVMRGFVLTKLSKDLLDNIIIANEALLIYLKNVWMKRVEGLSSKQKLLQENALSDVISNIKQIVTSSYNLTKLKSSFDFCKIINETKDFIDKNVVFLKQDYASYANLFSLDSIGKVGKSSIKQGAKVDKKTKAHLDNGDISIENMVEKVSSSSVTVTSEPIKSNNISLSADDYRKSKAAISGFAEQLLKYDWRNKIPYMLFRYGCWLDINSLPSEKNGVTEILQPPDELVNRYEVLSDDAPTKDLLFALEYELMNRPFWLEGHILSCKILSSLEQPELAQTIANEVLSFINKHKKIVKYKFKNGTYFISKNKLKELERYVSGGVCSPTNEGSAKDLKGNVEEVFKNINRHVNNLSKKSEVLATLNAADSLFERDMKSLATVFYKDLADKFEKITLKNWEEDIYNHITSRFVN